jgi:putative transposase
LYPNKQQEVLLAKHLGCCRFIYNYALDKKVKAYQKDKTNLSRFDIQADLPKMKKSEEYHWLSEVNSLSLQAALATLDSASSSSFVRRKVSVSSNPKKASNAKFFHTAEYESKIR